MIFLSLLISLAIANNCDESLLLLSPILKSTAKIDTLDVIPKELSPLQVVFRGTLQNVDPKEFSEVFNHVSKRDLKKLFEAVDDGKIKLSKEEAKKLNALREFVENDEYDVLWDESHDAWNALTTKYPVYRGPGYKDQLGGVIAGKDTYTMTRLESEILDAALGKPSRIGSGGRTKRFLFPTYTRVRDIIKQNNSIRNELHYTQEFFDAVNDTVDQHKKLLSQKEIAEVNAHIKKLNDLKNRSVKDIEDIYGQPIFTGGAQSHQELDIYKMADRIAKSKNKDRSQIYSDVVESAEASIFRLDEIINQARARAKQSPLALVDHHRSDLRIRHGFHDKKVSEAVAERSSVLSTSTKNSMRVTYEWTETEIRTRPATRTVTDANGNTRTESYMETYPVQVQKEATDTVHPSYNEVLHERLSSYSAGRSYGRGTITSVSGKSPILDASKRMSSIEDGLQSIVQKGQSDLESLVRSHREFLLKNKGDEKALLDQVNHARKTAEEMRQLAKKASNHLSLSNKDVTAIWASDNYKVFKARNEELVRWAQQNSEQLEVYAAQVSNKDFVLRVTPDLPDYSDQLGKLEFNMYRNYGVQAAGVGAAGVYGVCESSKYLDRKNYPESAKNQTSCLQDFKSLVVESWDSLF